MKNVKFIFFVLISIIFIFPTLTSAESITNNNGIVITEEEYNNFLKIYSSDYIMHMTEEKYNQLKEFDFNNIVTETKYVEVMYNQSLNLTTEKEITEEEYNNHNSVMRSIDGAASHETQAKKIVLSVVGGTTWNHVTFIATWKGIPSNRSYDVIGIRGFGLEFRDGSQVGDQIYIQDGNYTTKLTIFQYL